MYTLVRLLVFLPNAFASCKKVVQPDGTHFAGDACIEYKVGRTFLNRGITTFYLSALGPVTEDRISREEGGECGNQTWVSMQRCRPSNI
jgi:hypothetical protein